MLGLCVNQLSLDTTTTLIVSGLERGDLCIQAWRSVIRTPSPL